MNWDQVEGKWKQLKGSAKEQMGKLTDDDLDQIAGRRDQFVGKIQERYGIAKEEAQRKADEWLKAQRDQQQPVGQSHSGQSSQGGQRPEDRQPVGQQSGSGSRTNR
jgi:uncharacterized protein YjbJ (UPF0337 family)